MVALGDADAVPVGDYHLPHSIGFALEGTARSTDDRMLELLEPYRGHRARVIRLITYAGIGAPKFGPHKPLRKIANMSAPSPPMGERVRGEGQAKKNLGTTLSVQPRQLLLGEVNQLAHALAVEDQARAGGTVQLRQRPRPTERESLAILAHRLFVIGQAVAPHLQGAQLGDPVLDVIEG